MPQYIIFPVFCQSRLLHIFINNILIRRENLCIESTLKILLSQEPLSSHSPALQAGLSDFFTVFFCHAPLALREWESISSPLPFLPSPSPSPQPECKLPSPNMLQVRSALKIIGILFSIYSPVFCSPWQFPFCAHFSSIALPMRLPFLSYWKSGLLLCFALSHCLSPWPRFTPASTAIFTALKKQLCLLSVSFPNRSCASEVCISFIISAYRGDLCPPSALPLWGLSSEKVLP